MFCRTKCIPCVEIKKLSWPCTGTLRLLLICTCLLSCTHVLLYVVSHISTHCNLGTENESEVNGIWIWNEIELKLNWSSSYQEKAKGRGRGSCLLSAPPPWRRWQPTIWGACRCGGALLVSPSCLAKTRPLLVWAERPPARASPSSTQEVHHSHHYSMVWQLQSALNRNHLKLAYLFLHVLTFNMERCWDLACGGC